MGHFFAVQEREGARRSPRSAPVEYFRTMKCAVCPRNNDRTLSHAKLKPSGPRLVTVYILGSGVTPLQDKEGQNFAGPYPDYMENYIPHGWDLRVRCANITRCSPGERDPDFNEVECCRTFQVEDIEAAKPKVIIAVGNAALQWCIPAATQGIAAWAGRWVPAKIGKHTCWVFPLFDPNAIVKLDKRKQESAETEFRNMVRNCFVSIDKKRDAVVETNFKEGVRILHTTEANMLEATRILEAVAKEKTTGFDIETSGLKPYVKGPRILSAAVTLRDETFAFPLMFKGGWATSKLRERMWQAYVAFLHSRRVRKICHNQKFEQEWCGVTVARAVISNTRWRDTFSRAYVLDPRQNMLSLDTQILLYFGFSLKAQSNVDVKRLEEYPLADVLTYNALDAKWVERLYWAQLRALKLAGGRILEYAEHREETATTLALAQIEGLQVDRVAADALLVEFKQMLEKATASFRGIRGVREFKKKFGRWPEEDKPADMQLYFTRINPAEKLVGPSGKISTGEELLATLNPKRFPEAKAILDLREPKKVLSTYLEPLEGLTFPDGCIHPNFNQCETDTTRLSSSDPNAQNFPKRTNKHVRRVICAPPAHAIVAVDYAGIEARVCAWASQDDFLVGSYWTGYDIHGFWSRWVLERDASNITKFPCGDCDPTNPKDFKQYRDIVKNRVVFPLMFGSSIYSVQENLRISGDLAEELGEAYWSKLAGVREWQRSQQDFYERHGYVETLYGYRRHGRLSWNQLINTPIQGTAGELVLRAGNRLRKYGYQYRLNVHDDLTFTLRLPQKRLERQIAEVCEIMVEVEQDSFICTPLNVEAMTGPNWADLTVYKEFSSRDFGHTRKAQ